MGEKKKRRRRKKSKFGYYLYAVVVLILTIAILVLSILLLFHVQKIEVTGTKYSNKNAIIRWVRKDPHVSNSVYACIKLNGDDYEIPVYLEDISVHMAAPWSLRVEVKEKEIVGGIIADGTYVYFDEEGLVMEKSTTLIEDVPIIEDLEAENAEQYEVLKVENEKVFQYIVSLKEALKTQQMKPDRIMWDGDGMNICFAEVCVQLGKTGFDEKLVQLPPILAELEGKSGVLHLEHYNETNTNVSFEEAADGIRQENTQENP